PRFPWMGLVVLILLARQGPGGAQVTSEFRGGRWIDVPAPSTQETTQPMDPALIRIEQLLRDHKNSDATKAAIAWLKVNKGSPFFDRGLYLEAEALYQYGDRIKAFYYLDELLDEYPESPLYYQALEKQYDIADAYLNGYKRRFMKIPMLGAEE